MFGMRCYRMSKKPGRAVVVRLALAVLLFLPLSSLGCRPAPSLLAASSAATLLQQPNIKTLRFGLVVNQTSTFGSCHLVDWLKAEGIQVSAIFAPEHGFRGDADAGAQIQDGVDAKTQLPVRSLYGKSKQPNKQQLADLDVLLFDIQDVGVRYYTYLSTLHYVMAAAAEHGKAVWLLDRPNPNGAFVDGPTLDLAYQSFVGMHPIPLLHGMTLGELALMIKGEGWAPQAQRLTLQVFSLPNYRREQKVELAVKPSPNLPNPQAIALYPSLGFFEATALSVGRGTAFPFQTIGYTKPAIGTFQFTPMPVPGAALHPPLEGQLVTGQDLRAVATNGLDLHYLINWHALFKQHGLTFFTSADFMDKLAGGATLRSQIEQGLTAQQITASWQADLNRFRQQRQAYLLYPDWPQMPVAQQHSR